MKCKLCDLDLFIDEWNGWVFTCPNCAGIYRKATDEEIKELENE